MKTIKILNWLVVALTALILSGCYTMIEMRDRGNDNNGYSNDENSQNYQTPADSNYGDQYDQQDMDSSQTNINNYYGYSPYYGSDYWYGSPRVHLGFVWGTPFYDPFYWDPFGLWTYYPYNFYSPFVYNPYNYGYYGYYNGFYNGYYNGYNGHNLYRSRDTRNVRNNNGLRDPGSRGTVTRTNTPNTTSSGRTATTVAPRNSGSGNSSGRVSRSSGNTRSTGRSYGSRGSSRQYQMQMRGYARSNYNRNEGNRTSNNQPNTNRYSQPRSGSSNSGSYSAPRSSGPPPARSSGGNSGGGSRSSSGSGRRGR